MTPGDPQLRTAQGTVALHSYSQLYAVGSSHKSIFLRMVAVLGLNQRRRTGPASYIDSETSDNDNRLFVRDTTFSTLGHIVH